jgi:hypothetical protein
VKHGSWEPCVYTLSPHQTVAHSFAIAFAG